MAVNNTTDINLFLLQYISLTIAPAFIMGGIYFIFAQVVVIHGREFSVLKPMWYSYFFIATDIISLMIQAGGGGASSSASKNHQDTAPGTNTMIAGILFQVVAMTIFLGFWFEFLNRIYFKYSKVISQSTDNPLAKRSFGNYFKLLFNTKSARAFRRDHLDSYYNPKFADIRKRKLLDWFPLAVTVSVVAIYIRCVYRVAELSQGFDGYLVTTEVFLMVLDALMIAICGLIFVPFHPVWVFGSSNVIKLATIKKNHDQHDEEKVESNSDQASGEISA
jgi:RTA1 like protein.